MRKNLMKLKVTKKRKKKKVKKKKMKKKKKRINKRGKMRKINSNENTHQVSYFLTVLQNQDCP
ncbi:MAG: hypothetical protein ACK53Y_02360 [bacterium]